MPINVDGHALYVLSSPSNDKCYVYDDKLSGGRGNGLLDSAKADIRDGGNCYVNWAWGKHLVGDISNGIIYEMQAIITKTVTIDKIGMDFGHVSHGTNRYKESVRIIGRFKRIGNNSIKE